MTARLRLTSSEADAMADALAWYIGTLLAKVALGDDGDALLAQVSVLERCRHRLLQTAGRARLAEIGRPVST